MKKNFMMRRVILIIGALLISCNQTEVSPSNAQNRNKSKFSELNGPYLGQKPPGMKAEMFVPGLLTAGGNESKIAFSPDGKEFSISISTLGWRYLAEPRGAFRKGFMMHSHMENGYWTVPKEFSFCSGRKDHYPFFSPDGNKLFFNSNRGRTDPPDKSSSGIWYVERENEGWSEPQEIDFGEDYQGRRGVFPSVAANGNLYFALWPTRENGFLYLSRYENGKYSSPERLGDAINEKGGNHPYIAPDESYIIFDDDRSENNFGQLDLFISFRDENGKWMKVQNLGEGVNTVYGERRPFVSFDGKYLFFSSDRINPELPEEPISLKELQQLTNVHANGYQHIYWVDAKVIEKLKPTMWSQTGLLDNPPKDKAEIFAPGIVSKTDKEHSRISVSPDGKNLYWSYVKLPVHEGKVKIIIAHVTCKNGKWRSRETAIFNSEYGSDYPCFWGNDKIVFHAKINMSIDSVDIVDDFWMVKKQNNRWSKPIPLGFNKFSNTMKWSPSVSNNGNIYFDDKNYLKGQYGWGIYISYYQNNQYSPPVLLPEHINTEHFDWTPFIAPDESYLMFASNRPGSFGSTDIYITFKNHDGTWSNPINMGDKVNSKELERWPSISPDGKIMFFLRDYIVDNKLQNQDYYWIDAGFIEELKPDELK